MPTFKATVNLELDGISISGYPLVRRLELDESQSFRYEKVDDGDGTTFVAVPADQIDSIQALAIDSDQQITLRLDGQTDAGIVINAGGFVLLMDCTIDAGAGASNAKINRNGTPTANIIGIACGT